MKDAPELYSIAGEEGLCLYHWGSSYLIDKNGRKPYLQDYKNDSYKSRELTAEEISKLLELVDVQESYLVEQLKQTRKAKAILNKVGQKNE